MEAAVKTVALSGIKGVWNAAWGALVSGFNGLFITPITTAINGIRQRH